MLMLNILQKYVAMYRKKFVDDKKGDGLFATRRIKPGSTLLKTDVILTVLDKGSLSNHCNHCLSASSSIKKCSRCKHVYFCSKDCQRASWTIHKLECSYLQHVTPSMPVPAMVRICALFAYSSDLRNQFDIQNLAGHENMIENESSHEYYPFILKGVIELFKSIDKTVEPSEVFDIYNKLIVNMFTLENEELQCIGSALIPTITKLNHSCDPNCVVSFVGRTASVRAIKDIPNDSEITISYIPLPMSHNKRTEQLYKQYNFKCSCSYCNLMDIEVNTGEQSHVQLVSIDSDSPLNCDSKFDRLNSLIDETENHISSQSWRLALDTGLEAVPLLSTHACYYPSTGLFLAKMGKLLLEQDSLNVSDYRISIEKGLELFHSSLKCLCISLPERHKLRLEVEDLYRNAKDSLSKFDFCE